MREIKFRAWDKEIKKMREVQLMDFSDWWVSTASTWEREDELKFGERNSFKNEETDRHILMQYTGLKDCEGNEIYEGDILKFNDNLSVRSGVNKSDNIIKGQVIFDRGMYLLYDFENEYGLFEILSNDKEAKIIGNMYESGE